MYAGKIVEGASTNELFDTHAPPLLRGALRLDPKPRPGPRRPPRLHPRACRPTCPAHHAAAGSRPAAATPRTTAPRTSPSSPPPADAAPSHLAACFHQVDVDPRRSPSAQRPWPRRPTSPCKVDERRRWPGTRRGPTPSPPSPVLVRVEHVVKEFPVTAGAVVQRKIGTVKAVSDVSLRHQPGRDLRARGRVGMRQDHHGPAWSSRSRRPTDGAISFEGEDISALHGADAAPSPPRHAAHVPGPLRVARPPHARRLHPRASRSRCRASAHATEQKARVLQMLGEVGLPATRRRAVPPRVLRRPAPAHRPGPRPRPRAQA